MQECKRNKREPTKEEVVILHEIRRPNSLKTVPSGIANCHNLPYDGTTKSQRSVFQNGKCAGAAINVYSRKTSEKPKRGLRILKIRAQELFTHGEGISIPRARHKG